MDCLKCKNALAVARHEPSATLHCEACGVRHDLYVFPAYFRAKPVADAGTRLVVESEASCFYHPSKRAGVSCDICGRFLCALCATNRDEQQICLECLTQPQASAAHEGWMKRRILYDDIALGLALLPLLMWPFTLMTAPAAIFMVLKYWRRGPTSLVRRTRIRYVLALLFALPQFAGWVWLLAKGISAWTSA